MQISLQRGNYSLLTLFSQILLFAFSQKWSPQNNSYVKNTYFEIAYAATFHVKVNTKSEQNFTQIYTQAEERTIKTSLSPLRDRRINFVIVSRLVRASWTNSEVNAHRGQKAQELHCKIKSA